MIFESEVRTLQEMFPDHDVALLRHILQSNNGDVSLAVAFLLDHPPAPSVPEYLKSSQVRDTSKSSSSVKGSSSADKHGWHAFTQHQESTNASFRLASLQSNNRFAIPQAVDLNSAFPELRLSTNPPPNRQIENSFTADPVPAGRQACSPPSSPLLSEGKKLAGSSTPPPFVSGQSKQFFSDHDNNSRPGSGYKKYPPPAGKSSPARWQRPTGPSYTPVGESVNTPQPHLRPHPLPHGEAGRARSGSDQNRNVASPPFTDEACDVEALLARYPRADEALLVEVVSVLGTDWEMVGEVLREMGLGEGGEEGEREADGEGRGPIEVMEGPRRRGEEEEDIYHKYRGDALKVSRARSRHIASAVRAFQSGDHTRARQLAQAARDERQVAEDLHAQAAKLIVQAQNVKSRGIWELDLHGLHGGEAVHMLEERLALVEKEMRTNPHPQGVPQGQRAANENVLGAARNVVLRPELMVITGRGLHSKGGPTIPSVIASFLVENGYTFRQVHAGCVAIRPMLSYRP